MNTTNADCAQKHARVSPTTMLRSFSIRRLLSILAFGCVFLSLAFANLCSPIALCFVFLLLIATGHPILEPVGYNSTPIHLLVHIVPLSQTFGRAPPVSIS